METFAFAALGLGVASILVLLLLIVRRLSLARAERRRVAVEERLRPVALAIVHGDTPRLADLIQTHVDAAAFASLLARLGRQVRGGATERIAAFFEQRGYVEHELDALRARRAWRRASAAYALGDMGSGSAAAALLERLVEDSDRDVRSASARSLGRLRSVEAATALLEALVQQRLPRAIAGQALLELGPGAVPGLLVLVGHEDPALRAWAVELVGLVGAAGDASPVLDRLQDASAEVRERAARALGRLGAREAAAGLRSALDDRVPGVRAAAAFALGQLRDREAADALLRQARDDSFDPAQAAAEALARVDEPFLLAAAEAEDSSPHLREAADLARL
jgi:HEAT repeat protein